MSSSAIFYCADPQLTTTLQEHCGRSVDLKTTSSINECKALLLVRGPTTLILDCCTDSIQHDVKALLEWVGKEIRHAIRLVALSDGRYSKSLVAQIDQLGIHELRLPLLFEDVNRVLALNSENGAAQTPGPMETKALRANGTSFLTRTPEMFSMVDRLEQIARHDVTLLLIGETGTGKTYLAKLIHELSERNEGPFATTSCGALPPELIESELFGHVRGAFTSADRSKAGRFEAAEGGTLLLDEIDVLSPKEQTRLLRVIETGEYEPVGTTSTRQSNVRLIVASNVDLTSLTARGKFRSDLYYRLNVLEFHLLPLRERRRDIVPLAMGFIEESCAKHGVDITHVTCGFLKFLHQYEWPGNLRELSNQVRRAVLLSRNGVISADSLSESLLDAARNGSARPLNGSVVNNGQSGRLNQQLAKSEREILLDALRENNNNRSATARVLGISRVGLYKRMRRVGLMPPAQKKDPQPAA